MIKARKATRAITNMKKGRKVTTIRKVIKAITAKMAVTKNPVITMMVTMANITKEKRAKRGINMERKVVTKKDTAPKVGTASTKPKNTRKITISTMKITMKVCIAILFRQTILL